MTSGHHVPEEVATDGNETPSLVLSIRTLAGLHGPHHMYVFLCQSRAVSNTRWMIGSHHVLDEVASQRHEILHSVLSLQTLTGLQGQRNAGVFLCRRRAPKISEGLSKHGLGLLIIRKQEKVCNGAFLKKERQWIDETERMHQAPTLLKLARLATQVIGSYSRWR